MKKRLVALMLTLALSTGSVALVYAAESIMDVICAPSGITITPDGDILVTDTYHKVIWQIRDGASTIFAGGESVKSLYGEPTGGYYDSSIDQTLFQEPWAIAPYMEGYAVSDPKNNVVRLIQKSADQAAVGTLNYGFLDGVGTTFNNPTGLAADQEGNLYIADTNNNCIRKGTENGKITTLVSGLNQPTGLCYRNQTLYVADSGNHRILAINNGEITVVAGGGDDGFADGSTTEALFSNPQGVAVSEDGIIYVSDTGNAAVRKIENGTVSTLLKNNAVAMDLDPVSPVGIVVYGDQLLICDNYSRKLISITR